MKDWTRRQVAGALLAAPALGQQTETVETEREEDRKSIATLKAFDIPAEVQPAFIFAP